MLGFSGLRFIRCLLMLRMPRMLHSDHALPATQRNIQKVQATSWSEIPSPFMRSSPTRAAPRNNPPTCFYVSINIYIYYILRCIHISIYVCIHTHKYIYIYMHFIGWVHYWKVGPISCQPIIQAICNALTTVLRPMPFVTTVHACTYLDPKSM